MPKKVFNPFYDSKFLITNEESPNEQRYLVEMCNDELIQLRDEINAVLEHSGKSGAVMGA